MIYAYILQVMIKPFHLSFIKDKTCKWMKLKYCISLFGTFCFLLFSSHPLLAQYTVKGKVVDALDRSPLVGAHVFLYLSEDSLKNAITTSVDGTFSFSNLRKHPYLIKFSFVGYQGIEKNFTIQNSNVDIGTMAMYIKENPIGEVTITENIKTATLLGDTLQFNADAYKTMPDASASDLAEKLPGVIIENNKIQAQGEDVKQVLVDGKPFFGYDPATALNTLPAEIVEKIQIFDQESDQAEFTGFSTGETRKTMNIITRARMQNGSFGKITGGYGYDNKYMAYGNYNIFKGDQRISLIAQFNNINQQNFAFEDLLGVMAGGGRRAGGAGRNRGSGGGNRGAGDGGMTNGASINDFMVPSQGGITSTYAAGINYSDKLGEKMEVSSSYFFNASDNTSKELVFREYLLSADSGQIYNEQNTSNSRNINHRLNGKIEYMINENNSILYRPRLTIQQNNGGAAFIGKSLLDEVLLNDIDNSIQSELEALSLSNTLLYRHKFAKPGRTLSINLGYDLSQNNGDKFLLNTTQFFVPATEAEILDQNSVLQSSGWNANSSIAYTEPAGENGLMQFNYRIGYREGQSDQTTNNFDRVTERYILFDTLLSNVFENDYLTHRAGYSIQYRKGNLMANAGVDYQHAALQNLQIFPEEFTLENHYNNLLFNSMIRIGKSQMNSLNIRYSASTDNPSLAQLQEVIDNSDPLQLRTGNSQLDQSNIHRVFIRYSAVEPEKSRVFFAMVGGEVRQNYIGHQTIYARNDVLLENGYLLNKGVQLTRPVNLDGYASLNSFITYGVPLQKLKMNVNFNASGRYSRNPALIDNNINFSNSISGKSWTHS